MLIHRFLKVQEKIATKPILGIIIAGYFIFPLFLLPTILPGDFQALDLLFYYTPEKAYHILTSYDETARLAYISGSRSIDALYPVYYATLFGLILTYFCSRCLPLSSRQQVLRLLPYVAMMADWLENAGIVTMLRNLPQKTDALATITAMLTTTKWLFVIISILLCAYFALMYYRLHRNTTRRNQPAPTKRGY